MISPGNGFSFIHNQDFVHLLNNTLYPGGQHYHTLATFAAFIVSLLLKMVNTTDFDFWKMAVRSAACVSFSCFVMSYFLSQMSILHSCLRLQCYHTLLGCCGCHCETQFGHTTDDVYLASAFYHCAHSSYLEASFELRIKLLSNSAFDLWNIQNWKSSKYEEPL